MPVFNVPDLRTKVGLERVPAQAGWYKWWAPIETCRALLGDSHEQVARRLTSGNAALHGYSYIYVGIAARESVRARINWHVNEQHKTNSVRTGFLSTLRQSISSLVGRDMMDQDATNALLDTLKVEVFAIPEGIGTEAAKDRLEAIEAAEMRDHALPLNIQGNHNDHLKGYRTFLKNRRNLARAPYRD